MALVPKGIVAPPAAPNPLERLVRSLLARLGKHMREKAHVRIVITLRDGKITLINEDRTYLPDNFPES